MKMKLLSCWRCPLVLLLSIDIGLFTSTTLGASSATTLFNVPQTPEKGNCDGKDMDKIIRVASDMAQAAISAIDAYSRATAANTASPTVWNTYQAAWAMFGAGGWKVPLLKNVQLKSDGLARLKKASGQSLAFISYSNHTYALCKRII